MPKMKLKPKTVIAVATIISFVLAGISAVSLVYETPVLAFWRTFLTELIGWTALFTPLIFILTGLVLHKVKWRIAQLNVLVGFITMVIALAGFSGLISETAGGAVGFVIWRELRNLITLYKQVAKGHEHLAGKSLKGIVITSIIGFMLSLLLGISLFSFAVTQLLPQLKMMNEAKNQQDMYAPSYPDQMNDTIPTEEQLQEMMKQLPKDDSMMFENQAI